jgi:hypothetical protein
VPDEDDVLRLIVERAQAQLASQFRDADALDVKALGVLAIDGVALGVLIAAHDLLNRYWWAPAAALGLAGGFLLLAVWPRRLDEGPNWRIFYEQFGGGTVAEVGRQMLSELLTAIDENRVKRVKGLLFKIGFVLLSLGLAGSLVVGLDR